MRAAVFVLSVLFVASTAVPASAQIGGILRGANKAISQRRSVAATKWSVPRKTQLRTMVLRWMVCSTISTVLPGKRSPIDHKAPL